MYKFPSFSDNLPDPLGSAELPSSSCRGLSKEEFDCRVALLLSKGINDQLLAESLLLSYEGDDSAAFQYHQDLTAASLGNILPPAPENLKAAGFQNAGNSCYLDSLLFAMFSSNTLFDSLLVKEFDDVSISRLQLNLIVLVNQLRGGRVVKAGTVEIFRGCLQSCGFAERNTKNQEDASELFLFLVEKLGAPTIPVKEVLFHGGAEHADDKKDLAERVLPLALPAGESPIPLEQLVQQYFHHGSVSGILRNVDEEKDGNPQTNSSNMKKMGALKTLSVVPSFPKDGQSQPSFILPLMIARYSYEGLESHRVDRKVVVPAEMDFNPYLLFENASSGKEGSFLLQLTGMVCHQGKSVHAGHYISYALDHGDLYFHNDLDSPKVQKRTDLRELNHAFNKDIASDCYLLFYELLPGKVHSEDHNLAEKLQQKELKDSSKCLLQ